MILSLNKTNLSILFLSLFLFMFSFIDVCQADSIMMGGLKDTAKETEVAGVTKTKGKKKATVKTGTSVLLGLVGNITRSVLGLVGVIAMIGVIAGGFMFLTSGGSPEKVKNAQKLLVWGGLGVVVIFGAYSLTNFLLTKI